MERSIAAFSGRSTERGQTDSFEDVYERLSGNGKDPVLIIFSSDFDNFMLYTGLFHERFPYTQIIGTTSSCSYTGEGGAENALAATAVYSGIECVGGVLEDAGRCPIMHIAQAVDSIKLLGLGEADAGKMCCLEFTTAYGKCEELVIDTLREASGTVDIPVFGSTSGVRKGTKRSYVSLNGKVYTDSGVFMYIRNTCGRIAFLRENSYKHTEHFFQFTSVDCEKRLIYEINGRPAAPYIASLLGVEIPVFAENIQMHPIGRLCDSNIYITDCESVGKDGSVSCSAHIYNYSRGVLLVPDDANAVGKRLLRKIDELDFSPSFSFAVNCAFDYDIFEGKGFTQSFIKQLGEKAGRFSGVSGCGEQTDNMHINKTLLFAAFE